MKFKNILTAIPKPDGRILTLLCLCVLLVASSLLGAENRQTQTVSLPVSRVGSSVDSTPSPSPDVTTPQASTETLGSFTTYKLEMDAARDQAVRMLDTLIADQNADAATVEQARNEKLALAKAVTVEATLQGLISARGYGEAYVTARTGSVNVVIKGGGLTDAQTASILEMVTRETGESPENVKIISAK